MSDKVDHREQEIDLIVLVRNFAKLLWRHWWLPVLLALVCGVCSYVYTWKHYTPMYRAEVSTTVMVAATANNESYGFYYDNSAANQLAKTFPYILSSQLLMDALKEDMGVETINGSLAVSMVEGSNMLTLSVTSPDPTSAKEILESVLRVYPEVARVVIGNIELHLIDTPTVPLEPCNFPNYMRRVAIGGIVGAGIGLALLVVAALWSKKIQGPEELKPVSSMVCLGKISALGKRKRRHPSILETGANSGFADEISSLSLSVQRELGEIQGKILMVTSTVAEEGKSVVAENLAYALAGQGKRVVLVDADLRKQDMWEKVGAKGACGLWEMTTEGVSVQESLERCEPSGIFFVGGRHPAPSVPLVLNAENLGDVCRQLAQCADYVVLDTPPAQLFEDASILSRYADGLVYVVRHDWIQRHQILEALTHLGEAHAKILGFVYNGQPHSHVPYGYGYGYRYGYGYSGYGYGYGKRKSKRG